MRTGESVCTLFEFVLQKMLLMQSCFSELASFTSNPTTFDQFFYDAVTHRFKQKTFDTYQSNRDFFLEIKLALEDLVLFPKNIMKLLQFLLVELNLEESKRVNQELYRLIHMIEVSHAQINNYILHEKEGPLKNEIIHLEHQLKNLISEMQALEIETEKSSHEELDTRTPLVFMPKSEKKSPKEVLKIVTEEVDAAIRRLPFAIAQDEREKLINKRFQSRLAQEEKTPLN